MLLISTYVAPSGIQGLGVFADEYIPAGSLIWRLDSKFDILVSESDVPGLPPHMQIYMKRYSFPHLEQPGYRVIDVDNGKYMNHSLAPNTDFRIFDSGYALVDIARGEEMTCNYHEFDPDFVGFFTGDVEAVLDAQEQLCAP